MDGQLFELIVGAVLPPFIDFANRHVKSSDWRYALSVLVCLAVGAVLNLSKLSFESVLGSGAIMFAAAQTVYKTYYAGSGVREKLYGKAIAKG